MDDPFYLAAMRSPDDEPHDRRRVHSRYCTLTNYSLLDRRGCKSDLTRPGRLPLEVGKFTIVLIVIDVDAFRSLPDFALGLKDK
jgi:hypothetical protein